MEFAQTAHPGQGLSGNFLQNPKEEHGDHAGDDENRAGSDDEIDVTAPVGGHQEPERHEDAADGD